MKLLRCHIEQFGKLSNQDIEFADGINVIHEQNAWGKSTLAAFIKAMLYGLENRKEPGTFEKERKRYRPWQGGTFGGQLELEINGKQYRICRTFGQTEKTDEFHLFDCATNLESADYSSNIGEELFELDAISFKRSIYIAQNDCDSRTSDAINAKLGNLVENTNDINNYEKAQELLKNLANQLTPNRATGSLKKRMGQIVQLEQEIRAMASADEQFAELNQRKAQAAASRKELLEMRARCVEELKLASEAGKREEVQKHYRQLVSEKEEYEKILAGMEESFPNGIPDEKSVACQLELARKLQDESLSYKRYQLSQDEEKRFFELQERFRDFSPTDEMIEEVLKEQGHLPKLREDRARLQARLDEQEKRSLQHSEYETDVQNLSKSGRSSLIVGLILLIAGIGAVTGMLLSGGVDFGTWSREIRILAVGTGAVVAVAGVVLFFIGLIRNNNGRKKSGLLLQQALEEKEKQEEEVQQLQAQEEEKHNRIKQIQNKMRGLLEKCHIHCKEEDLVARLYELKGQVEAYHRLKDQKEESCKIKKYYENDSRLFWVQMKNWSQNVDAMVFENPDGLESEDVLEVATQLQKLSDDYRVAKRNVAQAQRRLDAFVEQNHLDQLETDMQEIAGIDELNAKMNRLDEDIEQERTTIEQCDRQLEDVKAQLDIRDEKKQELLELQMLQENEEEKFEIVSMTQEYLKNAREQLTARYMKPISDSFAKYYQLLLGENAGDWQIDANVSFMAKEEGQLRQVQQLSAGYQDLIGVCMRLALVDAMYPQEKPMLIFDDPFVNLDEEKTLHGMELLQKVSKEYQMIYFTCHSSRVPDMRIVK